MSIVVAGATATLTALAATPLVIRAAHRHGLYDVPGARRVHTAPVPRLGGVAVCAAFLAGLAAALLADGHLALSSERARFLAALLAGGGILFVVGLVDDVRGVPPRYKLLAQAAAGVLVYALGFRIHALTLGGVHGVSTGWLALPLTVLWVVAVTNAFNLIDGLDGLATGIAIVALGTTLWVAVALKQHDGALAAAALLGALLGFLRFNFNPARIFLGDSGSLFVGFLLAVLSVASSTKSSTAVLAAVPLLALGLPLTDVALAMLRRWLRGVSFASADRRHIHHQLLALGLSQRRAAVVMYVASTALAGVAIVIVFSPPRLVLAITGVGAALCVAFLALGVRRLAYHELAAAGAVLAAPLRLRRIIQDRINAHDLAEVLRMAESLAVVNAVLEDHVPHFGFAHMEVCFERELGRRRPPRSAPHERLWWMVSPLMYPQRGTDHLALAIWCPAEGARRPHGAERIAQILGPVLSEWASRNVHALPVAAARYPEPQFEVPPFGVKVDRAAAAPV